MYKWDKLKLQMSYKLVQCFAVVREIIINLEKLLPQTGSSLLEPLLNLPRRPHPSFKLVQKCFLDDKVGRRVKHISTVERRTSV
jgi:hypothetical protein